jgi:hypothetical protein
VGAKRISHTLSLLENRFRVVFFTNRLVIFCQYFLASFSIIHKKFQTYKATVSSLLAISF